MQHAKVSPANVIPFGYIHDRNQLREVYSVADVFVNGTREDSFSVINIEVQACGAVIVAYANTGLQETLDGISSFSVESGNTQALLAKIREIKTSGKHTYSHTCREFICRNFHRDVNYHEFLKLYEQL